MYLHIEEQCKYPLEHQEKLGVAVRQGRLSTFSSTTTTTLAATAAEQCQVEASAGRRIRLEDDGEPTAPPPVSGTAEGEGFRRG